MRFYGYSRKQLGEGLLEMRELRISANPNTLREIAAFLNRCADEIEAGDGSGWDQEHFAPTSITIGKHTPEFIVVNTRSWTRRCHWQARLRGLPHAAIRAVSVGSSS